MKRVMYAFVLWLIAMSVVSYCSVAKGQDFLPAVDFGKSLRVVDGDTVMVVLHYRGDVVVRFAIIDAFETYRDRHIKVQEELTGLNATTIIQRGEQAKQIVQSLLPPNTPIVVVLGDHRYGYYGRLIATVYIFRGNRWINLNEYLLTKYPNLFLETDLERRQVK